MFLFQNTVTGKVSERVESDSEMIGNFSMFLYHEHAESIKQCV